MPRKYIPVAQRRPSDGGPSPAEIKSKTAQMAQNLRWTMTKANETEVANYVASLPTSESLELIKYMRINLEAACVAVERKIQAGRKEFCVYCGGPQYGRGWRMETTRMDPVTLQQRPIKFCSDRCVVMWNQKQHGGIAALPDRGGKFGPDQPLKEPIKPPNGEAPDVGSEPV